MRIAVSADTTCPYVRERLSPVSGESRGTRSAVPGAVGNDGVSAAWLVDIDECEFAGAALGQHQPVIPGGHHVAHHTTARRNRPGLERA